MPAVDLEQVNNLSPMSWSSIMLSHVNNDMNPRTGDWGGCLS